MYNLSLNEKDINFKDLEQQMYKFVCRQACEMLSEIMTNLDEKLMKERDKKKYRNKGLKTTTIKTIMSEIEYNRRIYEYKTKDDKKAYKYLLDEYLKMDTIGHISTNLVEKIVDLMIDESYRKTADKITQMTNQTISHTAAWNIVQDLGEKIEQKEKEEINLNKENKLQDEKETKILFEEIDGVWISMQGENRGSKNKDNKEIKLGIFYEGWEKVHQKTDRYEVINKKAYNVNSYCHKSSSMPISNCAITNGRKSIQNLPKKRCASDIKLIY